MYKINSKIRDFFNSTKSIYIIILFSVVLGFLLEILIGTHFFKTNNYSKVVKGNDLDIFYKKNSFIVKIDNINKFVNTIDLNIDFDNTTKNIKCKSYYFDKKNDKHFIQNNNLGMIDVVDPIFKVGHDVKKIELKFNNNGKKIKINSIKLDGSFDFNIFVFLAISISAYLILDIIRYIYLDKKPKLYLYFLKISLIVGSFYAISTPFFHSWDEKEHMVRAYNISKFNFIQKQDEPVKWSKGIGTFIDNPYTIAVPTTYKGFKAKINYLIDVGKSKEEYVVHNSTASTYLFPAYFVSGVGMFIAQLLRLSFVFSFYMGRFFNLIFCSILLCLAVKYSGKYNKIFFALGLLNIILFQNASFSVDAMTNSFAILSVALTLYYKDSKKEFTYKDWIILLICYIMSFISKIAYFPIGVLILMIPNKKFKNKRVSYLIKISTLFICLALFGVGTIYANKMGIVQWTYTNADSKLQIKNIISNPLMFPYVVFNTIDKNILSMFLMLLQVGMCGSFGSLALLIIFMELIIVVASSSNNIKLSTKFILLSYVILSICSSMGALYLSFTPVGKNIVDGYQGRYILPILLPFLLLFVSKKFKLDVNDNKIIYFILIVSVVFYIVSFFSVYINKFYY